MCKEFCEFNDLCDCCGLVTCSYEYSEEERERELEFIAQQQQFNKQRSIEAEHYYNEVTNYETN